MRWLRAGLPELAGRALVEGLETACLEAGAAHGWVLHCESTDTYELLASLGPEAPARLSFLGRLEGSCSMLEGARLSALSPFPSLTTATAYHYGNSALLLGSIRSLPLRFVERIHLAVERIELEREVEGLRNLLNASVAYESGSPHNGEPAWAPELDANGEAVASPEEEGEGRHTSALALHPWFRVTAGTLVAGRLASALPDLCKRVSRLLGLPFTAVLVYEDRRVRLWGGEPLKDMLGPVFSVRKLGSLGRRVLEGGEQYVSSVDPARLQKNQAFSKLGLRSLIALPLLSTDQKGGILGGILLGGYEPRVFTPQEMEQVQLLVFQTALFLEQALTVHTADVERVVARAVLESMADGVYTVDFEKRITSFNPAAEAITGWPAAQAIGRTCEEVLRSQYQTPGGASDSKKAPHSCREHCPLVIMLGDQKLMDSGLTVEGSILTRDGEARYVSSTYSVVADKGDLLGAVVLFRDITEKRAIEQMKSDYAAALSHDLKTPLTAMKGYAVTLLRHGTKLDAETRQDALEVINSEIDRVTRMFDNLLHQARIEAGQQGRFIEPVPLLGAVKRVVSVHQLSSRRHRFSFAVPDKLVIRADRDQLDQILNNLVSNAVKYSPQGSDIHVTAKQQNRYAFIEVKDTGPGIPEDQLPFVFERFRRVQDRMSRKVSGSGLGLYITRMLVEGMEGEVGATSELGQGSSFWFTLPLHRHPLEGREEER